MTKKVFGIGFHKTATKSLGKALETLGYKVCGPTGVNDPHIERNVWGYVKTAIGQFTAFQDNPWPLLYKDLDREYPGSRFILTIRPEDEWLDSIVAHFADKETPMRRWIYGVGAPQGNEQIYLQRYRQHNQEVMHYFADRPQDLLVMDITDGAGWGQLCPFLERRQPLIEFPFLNPKENRLDLPRHL